MPNVPDQTVNQGEVDAMGAFVEDALDEHAAMDALDDDFAWLDDERRAPRTQRRQP